MVRTSLTSRRDTMDIIEHGSGPLIAPKPRHPDQANRTLLPVIAFATVAVALFTGVLAWDTHQDRAEHRELSCLNYAYDFESEIPKLTTYDELEPFQQQLVDTLDCDIPGR